MTNDLPTASALTPDIAKYRYADSCAIALKRKDIESWELIAAFFQSSPAWVDRLFQLRNVIVAQLGLKTGAPNPRELDPPYPVGRTIGLFRVIGLSEREAILGEDDSHLDFRISLLLTPNDQGAELAVSTVVNTKNPLGTVYFAVVKPIHRLIVPVMARGMAKKLDGRLLPQHR